MTDGTGRQGIKRPMAKTTETTAPRMSEGQRAYEAKRAAKAGKTLDQWLKLKGQEREALLAAASKAAEAPKKQGFFARLMERANKPL
jgi:acyl-CoA reductase-like NAD-dependent aldehyde dehydrogenase